MIRLLKQKIKRLKNAVFELIFVVIKKRLLQPLKKRKKEAGLTRTSFFLKGIFWHF